MNVADVLTLPASMYPTRPILTDGGRTLSYQELCARVAAVGEALEAAGMKPGDRVCVMQTDTPAVVELALATLARGGVFVPLSFRAGQEELELLLTSSHPKLLFVGARYAPLATAAPEGVTVMTLDEYAEGLPLFQTPDRPDAELEIALPDEGDLAMLLFTSGTSAAPKAVRLGHGALGSFVFNTVELADDDTDEATLICVPLNHVAGLTGLLSALFRGRRIVLEPQFDAGRWLELVASERVTHAFLVPTMLKRILDHPLFDATDLSSLRTVSYGAAPMPPTVIRSAIHRLPSSVEFVSAFGQTETTSTVTVLTPEDHRIEGDARQREQREMRLGSVGRPLPDVEVRIVDETGCELEVGQIGEVVVRTGRAMQGYDGQEAETNVRLADGWLHTRDLGYLDEGGYLFLAGRASDMIIRGGENIAPEQVEPMLERHPSIAEAAVFGVTDDEWGERVAAAVVPAAGAELDVLELLEYCRASISGSMRPEVIVVVDELPRNHMGKVVRRRLRDQFLSTAAKMGGT
jgi:acyl-CoA synthetase (AMP-forming)/AMP-acid ligase II